MVLARFHLSGDFPEFSLVSPMMAFRVHLAVQEFGRITVRDAHEDRMCVVLPQGTPQPAA